MEWLTDILGAAGSVAGGGIFGIFGAVAGQVSQYFAKKQEQKFQLKKWDYEKDLLKLDMEAKQQETEQELAIVSQQGAWKGLDSSISADAMMKPSSKWAQDIKSLFRPFLTISLWGLAGWVFYKVVLSTQLDVFTAAETKELVKYMVYSVFFSASTATVWWFGDRALTPPHLKNR